MGWRPHGRSNHSEKTFLSKPVSKKELLEKIKKHGFVV